jgi:hypothetical protein
MTPRILRTVAGAGGHLPARGAWYLPAMVVLLPLGVLLVLVGAVAYSAAFPSWMAAMPEGPE